MHIEHMNIQSIDAREVFRYMGDADKRPDRATERLVSECTAELMDVLRPRAVWREFQLEPGDGITVVDTALRLEGNDIRRHLKGCDRIIAFAVTLGHEADRLIRYYEKASMARALVLDACASAAAESLAEQLNRSIEKRYESSGYYLTQRYSPGYGDFSLRIQNDLLSALNAGRSIGLSATQHHILVPGKSVTAVIGLSANETGFEEISGCAQCALRSSCSYRKGGTACGAQRNTR